LLLVQSITLNSQSNFLWFSNHSFLVSFSLFAEVKLEDTWRVGAGEDSKEVRVQENRNRRDKETIYKTAQEMPSNPKEPWDVEMDYDDSLTLEIPIEQLPDCDDAEMDASDQVETHAAFQGVASSSSASNAATAQPDMELLAVLLNNPDLVFALTSGQVGNISDEQTLKLLDMIKRGNVNLGLSEIANGNYGAIARAPEKVEVSLPSPTPSSDPSTVRDLSSYSNNYLSKILSCLMSRIRVPCTLHFSHVGLCLLRADSICSVGHRVLGKWDFEWWPNLRYEINYFLSSFQLLVCFVSFFTNQDIALSCSWMPRKKHSILVSK